MPALHTIPVAVLRTAVATDTGPSLHYEFCDYCYYDVLNLIRDNQVDVSGKPIVVCAIHTTCLGLERLDPGWIEAERAPLQTLIVFEGGRWVDLEARPAHLF